MDDFLFWLCRKLNYPFIAPEVIQISLTYRCNLNCRMCSISGLLPAEEELSTAQITDVIDQAKDYGIEQILFTGGEPLLRDDIYELCLYAYKQGLRSVITTNGMLINETSAAALIQANTGHVHVSLDGMEEANDFFRGRGAFKRAVGGLRILREKRGHNRVPSLGIACTVMDNNIGDLYRLVVFADDLGIDVINFQPLIGDNANFVDKSASKFLVKKDNISALEKELKKVKAYRPQQVTVYEEPDLGLLLKYYKKTLDRRDWTCFGGFKTVFICYNERQPLVYSCHGICGNLNQISLKTAWRSKAAWKLRRHSRSCRNLCLQSCYSRQDSQSLRNIMKNYGRRP